MDNEPYISIRQRLAIEKQLLSEEKLIAHYLKTVREERHALQREASMYQNVLDSMTIAKGRGQEEAPQGETEPHVNSSSEVATNETTTSQPYEISLEGLDDVAGNEVELNLTVPSHNLYDHVMEDDREEFEEEAFSEDDIEIDMNMFMYGNSDAINEQEQ